VGKSLAILDKEVVRQVEIDDRKGFVIVILHASLHQATVDLIEDIAAHVPCIADYGRRLNSALARFNAGDQRYFTAPDRDSYHTVWFEFHQEMIGLLRTTRAKEAAAGRAVQSRERSVLFDQRTARAGSIRMPAVRKDHGKIRSLSRSHRT
jgi:hypothetical protein